MKNDELREATFEQAVVWICDTISCFSQSRRNTHVPVQGDCFSNSVYRRFCCSDYDSCVHHFFSMKLRSNCHIGSLQFHYLLCAISLPGFVLLLGVSIIVSHSTYIVLNTHIINSQGMLEYARSIYKATQPAFSFYGHPME